MGDIKHIERVLKALGSRRRLQIVAMLKKQRNATVMEVAGEIGVKIHAASQHLRVLRSAGIVDFTKRGVWVSYRLKLPQDKMVRAILAEI